MLAYCNFNGIGVIPWAPLAAGDLARPIGTETVRLSSAKGTIFEKQLSEADKTIVNRVEELANKKGVKMGQIALAWVGQKVASPIVGVNSIQRLKESIVTDIALTPEEVAYLEAPYVWLSPHQVVTDRYIDTYRSLFVVTIERRIVVRGVCSRLVNVHLCICSNRHYDPIQPEYLQDSDQEHEKPARELNSDFVFG